jgi:hypothetical protein
MAEVWFDALEGLARASLRDPAAGDFFDRSAGQMDQANKEEPVWPWLFRFDHQKLDLHRATGAIQAGEWLRAIPLLASLQPGSPKQAALVVAYQARAFAGVGDRQSAVRLALSAYDSARSTGSVRVQRAVGTLRTTLNDPELDDRFAASYGPDL